MTATPSTQPTGPDAFGFIQVRIPDDDGDLHLYGIVPHGASEGQSIMFKLMAAGVPAALEAIEGLLTDQTVGGLLDGSVDLAGLKLGAAADRMTNAIIATQPERMTREILKHTLRDGKPVAKVFDEAYQRNYGELWRALYAVVKANRFLPLDAISNAVSQIGKKKSDGEEQTDEQSETPSNEGPTPGSTGGSGE